ncbi:hypothetical protein NQ543_07975 [Thomasclavelia spiroformis DSM 1552]|uniref:Capsular polysaccharide assembling protein CapF C-terminal domain-containing protein n=1 Tax=Thomasclavelia spiroformis DSM 1552 TaxID=428126 RepID=B1C1B6_9FIRM|nr:hypothetical protein [Thomasclavelia spiroformis]EDS75171.1 hypothetical protein CLOSPI_00999 [Thomasclavelia spiroformis DSM 1552]UWO90822.1 hypothetical protein NQ543_07975 [Thomasclavelia spiroformis DSM 1552]
MINIGAYPYSINLVINNIPTGYRHNIINLSDSEDLVTLMWANESFDPDHTDTYYEEVNKNDK